MSNNIYTWKVLPIVKGLKGADAQKVGEAIETIGGIDGAKPQDIVKAARNDPVLHPHFEWNDSIGGELHRRAQARNLIASLRVERITDSGKVSVPAFVSLVAPGQKGPHYQPIDVVAGNDDFQKIMLANALSDLKSWMTRYASLVSICSMLRPVIDALEVEAARYEAAAETAAASVTPTAPKSRRRTGRSTATITP